MNQLKQMKAHFEAVIADAQRKLKNVEELLRDEPVSSDNGENDKPSVPLVGTFLKSKDIEKAILSINGVFYAKDVPDTIRNMFPGKIHYGKAVIPNALNKLTNKVKKLEYVEPRSGQSPASYRRKIKH
jgi:hypothetical protein